MFFPPENPCTFTRKLCVTCSNNAGTVKIRVSGNGLPNHCFYSTMNNSAEMDVDWSVVFNQDVNGVMNYTEDDFDTSVKTDEILCDLQRTASSNMNADLEYELADSRRMLQPNGGGGGEGGGGEGGNEGGGGGGDVELGTAAGIAITGGYIFNALDGQNRDAVENEGDGLDVCLSHPAPTGNYHYHYWGPCFKKDMGYWSDE